VFLPGLAWKKLSRYRKRTIITASAIAFGLAIYIFMDGWLKGAETESERNIVLYETGSSRVVSAQYWADRQRLPLANTIEDPDAVLAALRAGGIAAVPRTTFAGEAVVEEGSMPVRVIAIDPARDGEVFAFRPTVESGRFLAAGEPAALLGSWLADDLGLAVGDSLTVATGHARAFTRPSTWRWSALSTAPTPRSTRARSTCRWTPRTPSWRWKAP
jgi:ABC-type lipoprotein release transport system permease subunit